MTARSVTPAAATIPLQPGGASLRTGAPARLKSVVKCLGAWRRLPTRRSNRRGSGAAGRLGVRPRCPPCQQPLDGLGNTRVSASCATPRRILTRTVDPNFLLPKGAMVPDADGDRRTWRTAGALLNLRLDLTVI